MIEQTKSLTSDGANDIVWTSRIGERPSNRNGERKAGRECLAEGTLTLSPYIETHAEATFLTHVALKGMTVDQWFT